MSHDSSQHEEEVRRKAADYARERMKAEGIQPHMYDEKLSPYENWEAMDKYRRTEHSFWLKYWRAHSQKSQEVERQTKEWQSIY